MCHPIPSADRKAGEDRAEQIEVPVDDGAVPGFLAPARGSERGRVLLVHDVYGASPFYEGMALDLAAAGYTTLLPEFFWRVPLGERALSAAYERLRASDDRTLFRDQHMAVDWLRERGEGVSRIGVIGFCWGGTQVLMLASTRSDLVTVCYYGMPFDPGYFSETDGLRPIDVVGSMKGPIVAFWGEEDDRAGLGNVRSFLDRAKAEGIDLEGHIFPRVGHGFMSRASGEERADSASPASISWTRTIEFLDSHLGKAGLDG